MARDTNTSQTQANGDFSLSGLPQDAMNASARAKRAAEIATNTTDEMTTLEKLQSRISKRLQESLLRDVMSEDTLVGSINRYFVLKASLIATYNLVKYMPEEAVDDAVDDADNNKDVKVFPKIRSKVDKIFPRELVSINQEYHVLYNLEKTTLLKAELDMVGGDNQMPSSVIGWQQSQMELGAIKACLEAIKSPNDNAIKYGGTSMLISMGIMMLYSPSVLSTEQIDAQLDLINDHIATLYGLSRELANAPSANDAEIDALLEKFASLKLDDYVDNILSGDIFNIDITSPHTAALVSGASVALAALDACRIKVKFLRLNKMGDSIEPIIDQVAKIVATITARVDYLVRNVAAVAMKVATAALGVSDGVISAILGLKMQLQQWQKQYKEFMLGKLELDNLPVTMGEDMAPCAIDIMLMKDMAAATAEAAVKNAVLMPVMAIADVIMKPIFEAITDLTGEIQSYQDMLGSALSSAFNLVSVDRWIMYILCYQVKQIKDNINAQIAHYQTLRAAVLEIRGKIPPKDTRYALLERFMNANLTLLKETAKKHDQYMDNQQLIYEELYNARSIVMSMYNMLSGHAPSSKDKMNFLKSMESVQDLKDANKGYMDKIVSAYDNLGALWKETVDGLVNKKMIEEMALTQINLFRAYAPIPKAIVGIDIGIDIDDLEKAISDYLFPPPPPPPSVQELIAPPIAPQIT